MRKDGRLGFMPPGTAAAHVQPPSLTHLSDAAGYNNGSFYDPDSPSLGAWLERLPVKSRYRA